MSEESDPFQRGLPPERQGLYDPQFEHDACGTGFVVNIKGVPSHDIVEQALIILENLFHRGACGCEPDTGDGAGMLVQMPHEFLRRECSRLGIDLPGPRYYAAGNLFMPRDDALRREFERRFEQIAAEEGQRVLGWRTVPTDGSALGPTARAAEPVVRQVFIKRNPLIKDRMSFERKLYVIRKRAEQAIRYSGIEGGKSFYVCSLSFKTLVYKGMLTSKQVRGYYPDLSDPALESALAMVHSRFSTNTFPSWDRAHPYRYLAHNGEINTLRGNINWLHAEQTRFQSALFGNDLPKILPVINPDGSDSGMFDNVLELLVLAGRSLPHAIMMMIPEPWSKHENMSEEKRAFYEYHSTLMEPWDGPASMVFTDGVGIGATLDRNGLRPSRYYVTSDDRVILASEVGVLDIPPEMIVKKGRLEPGRMLWIDTEEGRIVSDEEIKHTIASARPYRKWLNEFMVTLEDLPDPPVPPLGGIGKDLTGPDREQKLHQYQQSFGYTFEDLRVILTPMARDGIEPVGSMGNDTPLAVLSNRPQLLYNYFKQLFAQVTNPPIDAIREEIVTATEVMIGSEQNLLEPRPENCRQIKLKTPILTNEELEKLRHLNRLYFRTVTLPILFNPAENGAGMERALEALFERVDQIIAQDEANIIILSDRGIDEEHAPIPALLAVSGLHHHLIRQGTRTHIGLVVESGEPREVHHFAALLGYGAVAINPYLAYATIEAMIQQGLLTGISYEQAAKNYTKAVVKGVVKVISKMGISTIQSYCGAQIFEAVGLSQAFVDKYFTWTPTRVGGVGIEVISQEAAMRHAHAFAKRSLNGHTLPVGGQYQWREDGEHHLFNPETVYKLQQACRNNDYRLYQEYARLINDQSERLGTLRGLLDFKFAAEPIPLDEVEPVESIVRRFKTGAMSYGSISKEAHEALAIAMNRIGGKSNTGEGGEDPARYFPDPGGDSRNSAIKQVASARFGVTSNYLIHARELQIKMAQGAKPGEGGQLPGRKVYPWIARVRHSTPGVGLISPPPHHDIYSIEDLAQLIHDLKNANPEARINVKLVSEVGVGTVAAGVAKAHADVVLISGHDGGTGASPQTSIKHAGLPWELGLAETHQTLVLNNLRSRIVVETDGQLKTGRDVAIAALLGAEEFGFATAPLVVLGCVMMRVCHLDTCPTGIATQNPELRKNFKGDPAHVVNFMYFVAQELREIMAKLGFRTIDEMVGRTDRLEPRRAIQHWKARYLDLSPLLYQPEVPAEVGRHCMIAQDHGLENTLDRKVLLELCKPAIERGERVTAELSIRNIHRTVGTQVGSAVTRRWGPEGLPEDTIHLHFRGSAGQSFGAFIPRGITLVLEGDSNDYIGKGLSGGKIIVYPPEGSTFAPEENIIIGNVAFYGATSGEAYIRGMAGERFCVRNSGMRAVVEGVGDHGCEYMTGGRVVVLGSTGRNFAAGMSGGIAYVIDWDGNFASRCNREMVDLERLECPEEIAEVRAMVETHAELTGSLLAYRILATWHDVVPRFVKVFPRDYKRMLQALHDVESEGLSGDEAIMAAFEINSRDLVRVSGN
ncbi:MAG TPA: glutamate synthase large subunit [Anaerolinea thermolimosa]|uniref:Glutamate synthase large subunit n=1 Tax=Anaerolinea thermolimosa TaxID=229919 RepID=A0A3D1JIW7_9CHLR|nr:glutamate synthase large subunit [Anaerolinea thermolimosa]